MPIILRTSVNILIWSLFLLIIDPTLILAGFKFGVDIRPVLFYALIAAGLFGAAVLTDRTVAPLKDARWFFLALAVLVALGVVMYRGENVGSDFGGQLLRVAYRPSSRGYVVWPALNLVACAGLYLLARHEQFRRTIVAAAFAALVLQALTMEADMWWLAIFGDPNGRAGGIAQNANIAAVLVIVLASLTLPVRHGDQLSRVAFYAVMIAATGVLFSQSKTGGVGIVPYIACFVTAARRSATRWPHPAFTVSLIAVIAGTIWLSPVLHPSPEQIEKGHQLLLRRFALEGGLPPATLDSPVALAERLASRVASLDESTELRGHALVFYFDILKSHPFGLGTGFTNKFVTGPHNEWLKLAVDEGIFAPLLLAVMLFAATWQAIKSRSPALLSIALISWIASALYHTMFVEPLIPTALAMAMGMASPTLLASGGHRRSDALEKHRK